MRPFYQATEALSGLPWLYAHPGMMIRDALRLLRDDGWYVFNHATKPGKVTVAGHPSAEVHRGILRSILKQAGLDERDC